MLAAALAVAAPAVAHPAEQVVLAGEVRVQALSPTLLRIEPKGPAGFEDRTTFMVVDRGFAGSALRTLNESAAEAWLTTDDYLVHITLPGATPAPPPPTPPPTPSPPEPMCTARTGTDVTGGAHASKYALQHVTQQQCCDNCTAVKDCGAWVFQPSQGNCWLLKQGDGYKGAGDRVVGGKVVPGPPPPPPTPPTGVSATVLSLNGTVLWTVADLMKVDNRLYWPAPLKAAAYAISDYPRFYAPEWGPTPIPADAKVDPALVATNGYDFRNNQAGDTYVFLLGDSLGKWQAARQQFTQLAGPTPLLPDFAWGTWFTWWHSYKEDEAKSDIERWESDSLPIDVWALDMNWRYTDNAKDHFYNYPNTQLFPDFANNSTAWFDYLKANKLRTYFNDHPFPVASRGAGGLQTSQEEVAFRWEGLSNWMAKGLTYWWFDHNWGFSIPPPHLNTSHTSGSWYGLDNAAWGSHVYFKSVEVYDSIRDAKGDHWHQRPMTLTKFGLPDWRPGMAATSAAESPAHHRYPVWWTGDGVNLQASVQSMVDSGVYGFKFFVHSDCGGDYRPKVGGDLVRWAAHCTFGTILRFHGNDHRPWSYDNQTEDTIRSYLNVRYKLIPALISAGQEATQKATPIVARGDLFWPEHPEAASHDQYIHMKDTLVAPIWDSSKNETARSVWIPPGSWEDGWSGETVTGPQTMSVTQPYERIPMWHRKGGLMVTAGDHALRVDDQDWSELTLEAWPDAGAPPTTRSVYSRGDAARTDVTLGCGDDGALRVDITAATDGAARGWALRLHLAPGQRVEGVEVDGEPAAALRLRPRAGPEGHFPFLGAGSPPAHRAGPVAELRLPLRSGARTVVARVVDTVP